MIILGLNGSVASVNDNRFNIGIDAWHDAGAVLIDNGKIVCAFEEERLNRIKHTNKFPVMSIKACLEKYNISINEIDAFAFPSDEDAYNRDIARFSKMDPSFEYASFREYVTSYLKQHFNASIDPDRFNFVNHHLAHAASTYYVSGFNNSLILALDGWGDGFSGGVYEGKQNEIKTIYRLPPEGSLGNFYLEITHLLGFDFFDEYKVMGLAPYGDRDKYKVFFDNLYCLKPEGQYEIYWDRLKKIGEQLPPRRSKEPITQHHKDIARALQDAIECIIFHVIKHYQSLTGHDHLCLAGGVALNCTMTGKLLYENIFRDVFVQPASGDGGLSLGAALFTYYNANPSGTRYSLEHVFLGGSTPDEQSCLEMLTRWEEAITFHKSENIARDAARLIANGNVIGWFQGAAEYGPRALGNRSILADPRPPENKSLINKKIKNREEFRPFAPSLVEERVSQFFDLPDQQDRYSFMTFILKVKEEYHAQLGAVTHVDGTARLHTVSSKVNPKYYQLISNFGELTGVPVLLNTSFNNNCEPIVDTPEQAINCFLTTRLDYLVVGDFLIQRKGGDRDECLLSYYPLMQPYARLHVVQENGTTRFEVGNTYNTKKRSISHNMYTLLETCDGSQNLQELLATYTGSNADIERIIDEVKELWALRLIRVLPRMALAVEIGTL